MADPAKNPGIEKNDHVYARHPTRGPVTVRVTAVGKDGFRGMCEKGERWGVPFGDYLGHKSRMLQEYKQVDQGADGAILEGRDGQRRFLAGGGAAGADPAPEPAMAGAGAGPAPRSARAGGGERAAGGAPAAKPGGDDPLLDDMDRLTKAMSHLAQPGRDLGTFGLPVLFTKAISSKPSIGRPGLTLQATQDRDGKQTHRWVKLVKKGEAAPGGGGEAAKGGGEGGKGGETAAKPGKKLRKPGNVVAKPTAGAAPAGAAPAGAAPAAPVEKPVKHGDKVKFKHGKVEGEGVITASGKDGVMVRDKAGREQPVRHEHLVGDATPAAPNAASAGGAAAPGGGATAGGDADGLFDAADLALPKAANQPVSDEKELFAKAGPALAELQKWLDLGKGICAQLGYKTMDGSPDDVDWSNPPAGGLLFIARVKGAKRAAEKVEADYGGDWSQLLDPVRCSIAHDNFDDIKKTMAALKAGGMKLARAPKDRFTKPTAEGYRDVLMNVTMPNGLIGEVQLHLKSMLAAKAEGHKPYEVMRDIAQKPQKDWTPEESATFDAAFNKSKAIYKKAWTGKKSGDGDETD